MQFYHRFTASGVPFLWDFGIFWILGATGHGCSAEGTDAAPRAHGPGALGSQPVSADGNKKNQIASRFDFLFVFFFNLVRRYLTFVATALSNVRRDGVV